MRGGILFLCLLAGWQTTPHGEVLRFARPQAAGAAEIRKGTGFIVGRVLEAGSKEPVPGALVALTRYGDLPGGVPGGPLAAVPVTSAQLTPSAPLTVITS